MKRLVQWSVVVVAVAIPSYLLGQASADAEYQKVMDTFTAAYNKGDAAGIGALYTDGTLRLGPDGTVQSGRAAVQEYFGTVLAGQFKGAKLTLTAAETAQLTPDVRAVVGTFQISGGSAGPVSGKYLNTLVRQGGQWRIAASAVMRPATLAPPSK